MLYVPCSTYGSFKLHRYMCMESRGKNQCSKSSLVQSVKIYTVGSIKIIIR